MALSQRVAAVAAHLANNASDQSSSAQRDALIHAIATGNHTSSEIVQAAGAVVGVPWFSTAHRDAVMTALTQASAAKTRGTSWRPQAWHNFASLLPADVWAVLCDPAKDVNQKCNTLIRFLRTLGLRQPSEPTFARMAGLMAVACSGAQARDHTPDQMKDLYDHVKAVWKGTPRGPDPPEYITDLPESAFAFQAQYPTTFGIAFSAESPPTAPQLCMVDVCSCAARVAMRKRGGGIGGYGGTPQRANSAAALPSGDGMQQMMGMFSGMMQQMFQLATGGGNGGTRLENGANLTFSTGGAQPGPQPGHQAGAWATPGTQRSALQAAAGAGARGGAGAATLPALVDGTAAPAISPVPSGVGPVQALRDGDAKAAGEGDDDEDSDDLPKAPPKKVSFTFPSVAKQSPDEAAALLEKAIEEKAAKAEERNKAKKAAAKTEAKKEAAAPPKGKVKKGPIIKKTSASKDEPKYWNDEPSRSQIFARWGKGPGSTKSFKYGKLETGFVSKKEAMAEATKWVKSKKRA